MDRKPAPFKGSKRDSCFIPILQNLICMRHKVFTTVEVGFGPRGSGSPAHPVPPLNCTVSHKIGYSVKTGPTNMFRLLALKQPPSEWDVAEKPLNSTVRST